MQVTTEIRDGRCLARVSGDMTIYVAAELKGRIKELLADAGDLVLDLSAVEEFDSAGLQLIIWAQREAERLHKRFQLGDRSSTVGELVDLYNLGNAFG